MGVGPFLPTVHQRLSGLLEAQTETRILTPKAAKPVHPYVRQLLAADCLGMGWGMLLTFPVSWILFCQRQFSQEGDTCESTAANIPRG